jgi:hypothetical protein
MMSDSVRECSVGQLPAGPADWFPYLCVLILRASFLFQFGRACSKVFRGCFIPTSSHKAAARWVFRPESPSRLARFKREG